MNAGAHSIFTANAHSAGWFEMTHAGVDVVLVDAVVTADVLLVRDVLLPLLARGSDV